MRFLVIHGPNLNLLGIREKNIYGDKTYTDLVAYISTICKDENITVDFFQSNHEGAIIDKIQDALENYDGLVINPGAYAHTSIAIMDAVSSVHIPTVEVHLSDIYSREKFRQKSYLSLVAKATVCGKGFEGYKDAIQFLKKYILIVSE